MEFTEAEVKEKLKQLGYSNIPAHKLQEFMQDLQELVIEEASMSSAIANEALNSEESSFENVHNQRSTVHHYRDNIHQRQPFQDLNQRNRPLAFIKEKLPRSHVISSIDKENVSYTSCSDLSETSSYNNGTSTASSIKRKVARKKYGSTQICDESMTESEASNISYLENRFKRIPSIENSKMTRYDSSSTVLPSFIRTKKSELQGKVQRKCDPVNRYHQFKEEWRNNKVPGEQKHSSLRWRVREQMLKVDDIEKRPQRSYYPNNYVVPTDKKRQSLRWKVRTAIAEQIY